MSDLTQAALLNHPTLTKMIDRMVSDALVYRRPDPKDGRKVLIFISERGRALNERLGLAPICARPRSSKATAIARPKNSSGCCPS